MLTSFSRIGSGIGVQLTFFGAAPVFMILVIDTKNAANSKRAKQELRDGPRRLTPAQEPHRHAILHCVYLTLNHIQRRRQTLIFGE